MTDPDDTQRPSAYQDALRANLTPDAYRTGQRIGREIANTIGAIINQDGKPEPAITDEQWKRLVKGDEGAAVKISTDSLISALLHPRLYLCGDEDGGVGLHCRDHFDGGRPIAYMPGLGAYEDLKAPTAPTIAALIAEAAKHLAAHHRDNSEGGADGRA